MGKGRSRSQLSRHVALFLQYQVPQTLSTCSSKVHRTNTSVIGRTLEHPPCWGTLFFQSYEEESS
jgi:hypothetical protein